MKMDLRSEMSTTKPIGLTQALQHKYDKLRGVISALQGCVIGFSGGVDSTLLFAVAVDLLGERALAVTVASEIYPKRELVEAQELAAAIGGRHRVIFFGELDLPAFHDNPRNRCYYCKKELFGKLSEIADGEGLPFILDGANIDDRNDHRPGRQAAIELGVRSPLEEAGFTKDDIRALSHALGLPTWDKPAFACLASRFPYGTPITRERLRQVELAEESLFELGFRTLRVRYHGDVARLELGPVEFVQAATTQRDEVLRCVKTAGFIYVAIDLQGYRTGAMNEANPSESGE